MEINYKEPLYSIGITAKFVGVSIATLRIWEKKELIQPTRLGKNRYYSQYDIDKLIHIRMLLQEKRMNICGIKELLSSQFCWEIKKCKNDERNVCPVFIQFKDKKS